MLFGGEPTRVQSSIGRDPVSGVDILTSAILDFDGGVATFTCSTRTETDQRVHVYGTDGRISIGIPFNIPPDRPTRIYVTAGGDPPVAPSDRDSDASTRQIRTRRGGALRGLVLDGAPPPFPPRDAVANLRVIEAIFEAARVTGARDRSRRGVMPGAGSMRGGLMNGTDHGPGGRLAIARGTDGASHLTRRTSPSSPAWSSSAIVVAGCRRSVRWGPASGTDGGALRTAFVEEPPRRARPHVRRRRHVLRRRRRGRLRLRRRRAARPLPRRRRQPGALYRNESPVGGALRFERDPRRRVTDLSRRHRRLSARHRRRRDRRPRRPPGRRERAAARTGRLPVRAGQRALGLRRRRRLDHRLQRDLGGGRDACRRSPSAATWDDAAPQTAVRLRRQRAGPAGRPTARATRRRAAHAGLVHPVDAVQRLGPVGPARPARQQRPPLLRTTSAAGAAVAGRAPGEPPRALHGRRRLGRAAHLGHGHRQLRRHRRRLPGGTT